MSHRAGDNRALKADAAGSVRRAFKYEVADQLAADIDCTGPLSPLCDCHLHAGYDDAANLPADWRINVIHCHDEEYLGFRRRLPARIPSPPTRAIQRFLSDVPRRTVVPRSRLPRTRPCATHLAANLAHESPWWRRRVQREPAL